MAVYDVSSGTTLICTGTDITSAGIATTLIANPTFGTVTQLTTYTKTYYLFELLKNLQIGTSSSGPTLSIWTSLNENILINCPSGVTWDIWGKFQMGNVVSGKSANGGSLEVYTATAFTWGHIVKAGGKTIMYGSSYYNRAAVTSGGGCEFTFIDCDIEAQDGINVGASDTVNFTNSRIHHTSNVGAKAYDASATYIFSGMRVEVCTYGLQPGGTQTFSDIKLDSCTYHIVPNINASTLTIVNPDFTTVRAFSINSLDTVSLEFRYQLKITDSAGTALSGISVRAKDATGAARFDAVTNASGNPTGFTALTLQNSTHVGTTASPSSGTGVTKTDRAAHTIRIRHPQYLWADLNRSATVDNLGDSAPVVVDPAFTYLPATAAAITGVTITDHGGSPVSWNSKSWGITITGDLTVNAGLTLDDIFHYIRYKTSYTATFGGKSGLDWHQVMPNATETARNDSSYYSAVIKGVRIVDQTGAVFTGVGRLQADDGTYYTPVFGVRQSAAVSGLVTGSRVQIYDASVAAPAGSRELYNGVVGSSSVTWTDSIDAVATRDIRVRISYVLGVTAKEFIEANIGTCGLTTGTAAVAYLANQANDTTYNSNAVNGSAVTGITFTDSAIDLVNCNIAGGTVTWPTIYAAFVYWNSTATGIANDFTYVAAPDTANYLLTSMKVKNTSAGIPLSVTGGYGRSATTGLSSDIIDTTGGYIFLAPDHVVPFATGSGVTAGDKTDIAAAVRTNLTTELTRIDVATSTRLATAGYTAPTTPPTAAAIATEVLSAATAAPIKAEVKAINGVTLQGSGTTLDPMRPV